MTALFITIVLLSIGTKGVAGQAGPCTSATQLNSLSLRLAGYQLKTGEAAVGDYYMSEDWYSMGNYVVAKSKTVTCGTAYGWHIEGDLPADKNEKQLTVCDSGCSNRKTTSVRKCDDGTYVFKLQPLDSNGEAYCIEPKDAGGNPKGLTAPDIKFKPTISAEVIYQTNRNNLHFSCDFVPIDQNLFFTVEWKQTSGFRDIKLLHKIEGIKFGTQFKRRTALKEDHLSARGINKLPFTIMCSVTAQKDVAGPFSNAMSSDPKFCGFRILTAKSLHIKDGEELKITMQLTVPFGCKNGATSCAMHVDLFIPTAQSTCELSSLGTINTQRKMCGILIKSDEFDLAKTYTLRAVFGNKFAQTTLRYSVMFHTISYKPHALFRNYVFEGATVVVTNDNSHQINGRSCYSHNDPHIKTFEGRYYENQAPDTYVLYKHDDYPIEVQVKSKPWVGHGGISLNCGIAIRAGKDVFVYSHCDSHAAIEVGFRRCEDGVLNKKVRQDGRKYIVYLPTGTMVEILTSTWNTRSVNVDVIPSEEDIGKSTGLCGRIDGTAETPTPSNHRVGRNQDLFNAANYQQLRRWTEDSVLMCNCDWFRGAPPNDYGECKAEFKKPCTVGRVPRINHVCEKARKRRWALESNDREDEHVWTSGDTHTSRQTSYSIPRSHDYWHEHQISKRQVKVYDNATARAGCMATLNTTTFQRCSNLPNLDLTSIIKNCISDAKLTGTMEWSMSHLESIKDACIHHVRVNQPLSEEAKAALAEQENITSATHANFTDPIPTSLTPTNVSTSIPTGSTQTLVPTTTPSTATTSAAAAGQQFVFSEDLLQDIEDNSCPNECSGNGKCAKGACVCNSGFVDLDCSISADQPPIMNGIPDLGLCDKSQRACQQTSVFGEQIVESPDLSCKLIPFTVDGQSNLTYADSSVVRAEVMSPFEIICPLPAERQRREVSGFVSDNSIASGYKIMISNNGHAYSDDDSIVVFDSRCVDCSKNGANIVCRKRPGFCVRAGQCYTFGERNQCDLCGGDDVHNPEWIPKMDCPGRPAEEPMKLWIIAAVLVPVILLVIVATLVICCKTGQKGKGSKVDLHVIHVATNHTC